MGRKNKRKKSRSRALVAAGAHAEAHNHHTKPNVATDFGLVIPDHIFKKVMYWIDKASPNEVSGFGSLDFDQDNRIFTVRDVTLLEQIVSGGETEMDPNAINKAMFEMRAQPNALKWHWHSHPTFGVFWSGTDMNLIRELGQQGWILASVINCKREIRSAYMTTVEIMGNHHDIFVDEIATITRAQVSAEEGAALDKEFDDKVSTRAYKKWYPATGTGYDKREVARQKHFEESFSEYSEEPYPFGNYPRGPVAGKVQPPVPQFIADSKYDKYGFADIDGTEIYNPLHDRELVTEDDQFFMLSDMKEDEIEFLRACDAKFSDLVRRYIVFQAEKVEMIADSKTSEANWRGKK